MRSYFRNGFRVFVARDIRSLASYVHLSINIFSLHSYSDCKVATLLVKLCLPFIARITPPNG